MLQRKNGATLVEIMDKMGWQRSGARLMASDRDPILVLGFRRARPARLMFPYPGITSSFPRSRDYLG